MARWGIRVATDPSAGAGHVTRCAALAGALNSEAVFFADPECPGRSSLERNFGRVIEERRPDDASLAIASLAKAEVAGLVIDSYALPGGAIAGAARCGFTAVFRDGGLRGPEHLTIDTGAAPEAVDADMAAGPSYAPLDPRYADAWRRATMTDLLIADQARVLVAFGQRDSANLTKTALDAVSAVEPSLHLTCVMGATAPHLPAVKKRIAALPRGELLVSPADMIEVYLSHDLAIGAPGVSQLERMCCGLPSIILCQNETQRPTARAWHRQQCAEMASNDPRMLTAVVSRLIADRARRHAMRRAGLSLVDGCGADRLAARLQTAQEKRAAQSVQNRSVT